MNRTITMLNRLSQSLHVQRIKANLFARSGEHYPVTRGYGSYRLLQLRRAVGESFDPSALPAGFGRWLDERIVEYPWLLSQLPDGPGRLLDAGSTLNHDYVLAHDKLRSKAITIMTLAPEEQCFWRQGISYLFGDLRHTDFRDGYFDFLVSLSVIEHIGLDNTIYAPATGSGAANPEGYLGAVLEFRRALRPGGECYISVPFGKKSMRKWIQIFDGAMLDRVVEAFGPQSHRVTYFKYSEAGGWQPGTRDAAATAPYFDVHSDAPWPGCPAAAGAIACLKLIK